MRYLICFLVFISPAIAQGIPEAHLASIIQDANKLRAEVSELKMQVTSSDGPSAMSFDDFWKKLISSIDKSEKLLDRINLLVANVNVDISRVSNQMVSTIKAIQGDINIIAISLSTSVKDISHEIVNIIPQFNKKVDDLLAAIIKSIDSLSMEIENSIRKFTDEGITQITLLNDRVGTLILKFNNGVDVITTNIDEMGAEFKRFFEAISAAGIHQINLIGDNIVSVVQSINNGIQNISSIVSARIDEIGNIVVAMLNDVRILIQEVSSGVQKVNMAVSDLYNSSVGYINSLEGEVVPSIWYTQNGLNASISMMLRNIIKNDDRHLVEFAAESIDNIGTYSVLYGYRIADNIAIKGGLMRSNIGIGVGYGTRYADDFANKKWVWGVGLDIYGKNPNIDFNFTFGKMNGVRMFGGFRDVTRASMTNWNIGIGAGIIF